VAVRAAVIVLDADDDKTVRSPIGFGQRLQYRRCLALGVFLIHAIEKRQPLLQRIDEGGGVAAAGELVNDKAGCFDTLSGLSYRSVKNDEAQRHPNLLKRMMSPLGAAYGPPARLPITERARYQRRRTASLSGRRPARAQRCPPDRLENNSRGKSRWPNRDPRSRRGRQTRLSSLGREKCRRRPKP